MKFIISTPRPPPHAQPTICRPWSDFLLRSHFSEAKSDMFIFSAFKVPAGCWSALLKWVFLCHMHFFRATTFNHNLSARRLLGGGNHWPTAKNAFQTGDFPIGLSIKFSVKGFFWNNVLMNKISRGESWGTFRKPLKFLSINLLWLS